MLYLFIFPCYSVFKMQTKNGGLANKLFSILLLLYYTVLYDTTINIEEKTYKNHFKASCN